MFKPWKSSKRKMKATFILQFQATQVPKLKKPTLVIQLVPEDIGKPTFKLEKAEVQNGKCTWENPVYVTVKFSIDPKTEKVHEKLYHFIVSNGSSKSGYLGESSVDLADFADEIDPLNVSLPLKFANSGVVLHLTIRRVLEDGDGGFVEVQNPEEEWSGSEGSLQNSVGTGEREEEGRSGKRDVKELTRQAEMADLELQALRKQVMKEGKRVQELTNQMAEMRRERDALLEESSAREGEGEGDEEAFEMLMSENRELKGSLRGLKRELFYEKERTKELTAQLEDGKDGESERYITGKRIKDLSDEVAACKEEKEKLEVRVGRLTEENEDLKGENCEVRCAMKELEEEMLRRRDELAETVDYYEGKVREMEEEKERQKGETRLAREAKGNWEEKATLAEDSLRKMKWKIERVQEETRKKEGALEAALMESEDLRVRNGELEERIRGAGRKENGVVVEKLEREVERLRAELAKQRSDELAEEVAGLRERNRSMEVDLKEMEERYSEISLKFAEVEIERQQLVKTVRTLKGRTT